MPASYRKIHYQLRPAKNIERKMLCETFRRLSEFGRIEAYRYIGFGSIYFSDFLLFHKSLGITNMISIERDVENRGRFEFNRPFSCIRIQFGESNEILPTLPWDVRTILWLDYDSRLDRRVLTDVTYFCVNAFPGSLLVVTVNSYPDPSDPNSLETLKGDVGKEKVPLNITDKDLMHWGTADVYLRVIENHIRDTINQRNGGRAPGSKIMYRQLFNFHYSDSVKMLTTGGLLYDEGQSAIVSKCAFEDLSFIRSDSNSCLIEVPNLTYREIRHLDAQLPINDHKELETSGIPESDLERYTRVYRYFPTFAEAEM